MQRIISASLSPNVASDDLLLAIKEILKPWLWQNGKGVKLLQAWFQETYPDYTNFAFNSGRSAEYEILRAFGIGKGDEVIVQAFTCVAVPNSVIWNGATPIYVDIDENLNATPEAISQKISKKTRAIIVQHTFGYPADIKNILDLAHKKNIIVIEDCAHGLGVEVNKQLLGSFGDAAFFSFGRDKVVSSVFGGVGIIKSKHEQVIESMKLRYRDIKRSRYFWIFQQLIHPIAFAIILPLYNMYVGKILLILLQKLHILSFPVYLEEKQAKRPKDFPALLPNSLAILAIHQLKKLSYLKKVRRHAQNRYWNELINISKIALPEKNEDVIYLRFPLLVESPGELRRYAKTQGVILGNWYSNPVDPSGVDFNAINYDRKCAPIAEKKVESIVNLPTLISDIDISRVIEVIQSYYRIHNS